MNPEKQRIKKVKKILKRLEGTIDAKSGCEILDEMRKQTSFNKKTNEERWMRYEDDIIRYYYPQLIVWLRNGMLKSGNIQFTSGLGRDIARLMEDSKKLGYEQAKQEMLKEIDGLIRRVVNIMNDEGISSDSEKFNIILLNLEELKSTLKDKT